MLRQPPNLYDRNCPSRHVVDVVGGKWAMLIVRSLEFGPLRTGDLRRRVDGISQKMLTQTLRQLAEYGLVSRVSHPEVPPRVEYALTAVGTSLGALLKQMESWVVENYDCLIPPDSENGNVGSE
jgi:DNA-binding HxlR family transcriptional regulator